MNEKARWQPGVLPVEKYYDTFIVELGTCGLHRTVHVPKEHVQLAEDDQQIFEAIVTYGQEWMQPLGLPSVQIGDVIRYHGLRYRIGAGSYTFKEIIEVKK